MAINAEIDSDNLLVNSHVAYYHSYMYKSMLNVAGPGRMHGAKRVIAFCFLIGVLPATLLIIPLYLRHSVYADVLVSVAESDVLRVVDGISTVFCQEHKLKMNSSFNAFQMKGNPEISREVRKHIRLKKSMALPDDTLEYWGFYLLEGSSVELSVCSRYHGSSILVVEGERNLQTCGLMDHSLSKAGVHMAKGKGQVRVRFETFAQEGFSDSTGHNPNINRKQMTVDENVGQEVTDKEESITNRPLDIGKMGSNTAKSNTASSTPKSTAATLNVESGPPLNRKARHARKRLKEIEQRHSAKSKALWEKKKILLEETLNSRDLRKVATVNENEGGGPNGRLKRSLSPSPKKTLDAGIAHGGGNTNATHSSESVSSFENNLFTCYDGKILLSQYFNSSDLCTDIHHLDEVTHMKLNHTIDFDGYYYYIFYSDNDFFVNDIHAIFNIYKRTYQYANYSNGCINQTECNFPISMWSEETVIVEVPTRDGIEHEADDITLLISSCTPRMSVYIIFPVTVLFLILGCAFL